MTFLLLLCASASPSSFWQSVSADDTEGRERPLSMPDAGSLVKRSRRNTSTNHAKDPGTVDTLSSDDRGLLNVILYSVSQKNPP